MDKVILHLVLKGPWFNQVQTGVKTVEYRYVNKFWRPRIWNKRNQLTHVCFSLGYSRHTIIRKIVKIDIGPCPYKGWAGDYYRINFEGLPDSGQTNSESLYLPEVKGTAMPLTHTQSA